MSGIEDPILPEDLASTSASRLFKFSEYTKQEMKNHWDNAGVYKPWSSCLFLWGWISKWGLHIVTVSHAYKHCVVIFTLLLSSKELLDNLNRKFLCERLSIVFLFEKALFYSNHDTFCPNLKLLLKTEKMLWDAWMSV